MNPPWSVENLKNYILREIQKSSFMDFGLLYENDFKGEYVVLKNGVRMADIRLTSFVYMLVYVSTYCVPIALLRQNKPLPLLCPNNNNRLSYHMKNYGDLGGCYPPRPTLLDLHNSS